MSWRCVARITYLRSSKHPNPFFRNYSTFARNGNGCFCSSSLWRHPNHPPKKKRTVLFSGTSGSKPTQERLQFPASGSRIRPQQQRLGTLKNETPAKNHINDGSNDASHVRSKGQYSQQRLMRGRFNRIAAEKGLSFATYLYVLGESCTILLTYLLHTNQLYVGEVGTWLSWISLKNVNECYLDVGPVVFNTFRLSPRLFLNYLIANVLTLPLFSYQMGFCMATAPVLSKLVSPVRALLKRCKKPRTEAIPKAPSPLSGK
ncbi:unnamed protein product [Phytomonas sp. EM1]|nr:unnamed protein product [Phytomonas sp. EM1]|eukprot:CCW60199.1 unnamed protein product [Phytomonas sp. isolate EM1]